MDNVWVYAKGSTWLSIIRAMKEKGLWGRVTMRQYGPSIEEVRQLKKDQGLIRKTREGHEKAYEKMLGSKYDLLDIMIRKTDWGTDRYNSASIHELKNRLRLYFEYFRLILQKKSISLVVFWNTPHMGSGIALYEAATSYGITTLILEQSKFPNRFHHYFDCDDWGTFFTSKCLDNLESYSVKRKVEKEWFYMKENYGKPKPHFMQRLLELDRYFGWINRTIENNDYLRLIRELLSRERRSQSFFRFYTERNYKQFLKKYTSQVPCDFHKPFVYFPLHFQPEKVSTNWGGIFSDQVLALEHLSKLVPDDWYIYVKENPIQRGAYRDRLFFERMDMIPNLVYLPIETDTFELTRHSRFVATIVGTVGWEAITGGKNVLTFGWGAWYKTLPGVYAYEEGMDIHNLIHKPIIHSDLEKGVAYLLNRCGKGIIYDPFIKAADSFSLDDNTRDVLESLEKILYQT